MTSKKLKAWIALLTNDITFTYQENNGHIMPMAENDIRLFYNDSEAGTHIMCSSLDEAMQAPLIFGKSLEELATQIDFD